MAQHPDIIQLEIMGTHLQLRSGENPDAVRKAGALVKERIDELAAQAPSSKGKSSLIGKLFRK